MRLLSVLFFGCLLGSLGGCSVFPPKPPKCKGEFQPVNIQQYEAGARSLTGEESVLLCEKGDSSYVG